MAVKSVNDLFVSVTDDKRWIVNKNGELEQVDEFTIPIEYDLETGERLGALVEPPSTNFYPHAKKMDGALDLSGVFLVDAVGQNKVQFFPTVLYFDTSQKNRVENFQLNQPESDEEEQTSTLTESEFIEAEGRKITFTFDTPRTWTYYGISFFMRFPFSPETKPAFGKSDEIGKDFFIRINGIDVSFDKYGYISVKRMADGSYWVRARIRATDRPVAQITIGNGYYQTEKDFVLGGLQIEPYINTSPILTDGEIMERSGCYLRFKATPNKTINMQQGTYEIGWQAYHGSIGSALFAFNASEEVAVDVEDEKEAFLEDLRKEIKKTKDELVDDLGIPDGDPDDPCAEDVPTEKEQQLKECLEGLKLSVEATLCSPSSDQGDQTLEIGHMGEQKDNPEEAPISHSIECNAPKYKYHFCYGNENRDYNIKDWLTNHNVRMTFSPYGHRFVTNCSPIFRKKDFNYMKEVDPPTVFHLGISKMGEHMNGHIRYFNIAARALTDDELPFYFCFGDDPPPEPEVDTPDGSEPPPPPITPLPDICPFIVNSTDSEIDNLVHQKEFDVGINRGIVTLSYNITGGELGLKVFRNDELVADTNGLVSSGNESNLEFQYNVRDKIVVESESSSDLAEWQYTVSCAKPATEAINECPFIISSEDEDVSGKIHQTELKYRNARSGLITLSYNVESGSAAFRVYNNDNLLTETDGKVTGSNNFEFVHNSLDTLVIEVERDSVDDKWSYTASCLTEMPLSDCPFVTSFNEEGIDGNISSGN